MTEADLLRLVTDWLGAQRIRFFRNNTGAMKVANRFVRFNQPGHPDLLVLPRSRVVWVELKGSAGRQTLDQKIFQEGAEANGETYVLARSLEDVVEALQP